MNLSVPICAKAATPEATIIQTRHRVPEYPLQEGQTLVYQVPYPEVLTTVEPDTAKQKEMLATGISHALHHTAMGLSIAVTAIIFHLILTGMSRKVVSDLELFSMKLENFLVVQARGAAGASGGAPPGAKQ